MDEAEARGVPAEARRKLTDEDSSANSRCNGPQDHPPPPMPNDNKRGRARLREAEMAMTPKRRPRNALPRRSATHGTAFGTPQHVPLNLGQLEPGDTPQGKRTNMVPIPVPIPVPILVTATVCLEEQKSRLMQWKRHGLQLVNR